MHIFIKVGRRKINLIKRIFALYVFPLIVILKKSQKLSHSLYPSSIAFYSPIRNPGVRRDNPTSPGYIFFYIFGLLYLTVGFRKELIQA